MILQGTEYALGHRIQLSENLSFSVLKQVSNPYSCQVMLENVRTVSAEISEAKGVAQ